MGDVRIAGSAGKATPPPARSLPTEPAGRPRSSWNPRADGDGRQSVTFCSLLQEKCWSAPQRPALFCCPRTTCPPHLGRAGLVRAGSLTHPLAPSGADSSNEALPCTPFSATRRTRRTTSLVTLTDPTAFCWRALAARPHLVWRPLRANRSPKSALSLCDRATTLFTSSRSANANIWLPP